MVETQIEISEFAFFALPFIGHTNYYPNFLKILKEKNGVDIYLDTKYGKKCFKDCYNNYFELPQLDPLGPNDQQTAWIENLNKAMQQMAAFYLSIMDPIIKTVEAVWEKAKKKPKYIFTDNYCRHAEILAKKHNIPLIVGFGTFWIYDYPYDLRDDIIEKLFIGGQIKPPKESQIEDLEFLDNLEKTYSKEKYGRLRYWIDINVHDADLFLGFVHPVVYECKFPWEEGLNYYRTPRAVIGPLVREKDQKEDLELEQILSQYEQVIYFSMGSGLYFNDLFLELLKAFNILTSENEKLLVLMKISVEFEKLIVEKNITPNKNVIMKQFFPQITVLKKCTVFLTHAGMNSFSEALTHNVPMVVIPKANDAYIAADQIEALKFGIKLKESEENCDSIVKVLKNFMQNQVEKCKQNLIKNQEKYKDLDPYKNFTQEIEKFISKISQK